MTSQPDQIDESAGPILVELEVLMGPFTAEQEIASINLRVLGTTKPQALEEALRALVSSLVVTLPDMTARKAEDQEDYRLVLCIGGYWANKRGRTPIVLFANYTAKSFVLSELNTMVSDAMGFYRLTESWHPDV